MPWFAFALAAAFFWSLVAIIDKHAITDELRDPVLATTVAGFTLFLFFSAFSLFSDPLAVSPATAAAGFLSGVGYSLAILLYYKSSQKEEVSRVSPIFDINPLIVLVLGFVFLGEVFTPLKYAGVFLLVGGAVMISVKKVGRKFKKSSVIWLALVSAMFFAFRSFLLDVAAFEATLYQAVTWAGFGGLSVGLLMLAAHHPRLRKRSYAGVEHLLLSNALAAAAFFFFASAVALQTASLVASVISSHIVFVLLIAALLSRRHSHIIREEMRGTVFAQKLAAIIMVLAGMLLLA